jgi:hypothetical protein
MVFLALVGLLLLSSTPRATTAAWTFLSLGNGSVACDFASNTATLSIPNTTAPHPEDVAARLESSCCLGTGNYTFTVTGNPGPGQGKARIAVGGPAAYVLIQQRVSSTDYSVFNGSAATIFFAGPATSAPIDFELRVSATGVEVLTGGVSRATASCAFTTIGIGFWMLCEPDKSCTGSAVFANTTVNGVIEQMCALPTTGTTGAVATSGAVATTGTAGAGASTTSPGSTTGVENSVSTTGMVPTTAPPTTAVVTTTGSATTTGRVTCVNLLNYCEGVCGGQQVSYCSCDNSQPVARCSQNTDGTPGASVGATLSVDTLWAILVTLFVAGIVE